MDAILDPETMKRACAIASAVYFVVAAALFIGTVRTPTLRNAEKVVAPLLLIAAISFALIAFAFPSATQSVLPILYPCVVIALGATGLALVTLAFRSLKTRIIRIVAIVAAPLPLAVSAVLILIAYLLAHTRFCC